MNNRENLKSITDIFLDKNSSHKELFDASRSLAKFFEQFSSISTSMDHFSAKEDGKHTHLDSGTAISPLDAAVCINEYMRTTKFIRGIYEAIQDLVKKFKGDKIDILYAGTGPYGTLLIPLLQYFDTKDIEIVFLDIHQNSLNSVKNIIDNLDFNNYVRDYICYDATKYKSTSPFHLILTETMRASLSGEPQVNITLNLFPQLSKNGIFIPECITVTLEKVIKKFEHKDKNLVNIKEAKILADIIKLDTKKKWNKKNLIQTPSLEIKKDFENGEELFFGTQIKVYKNNILTENECSLNLPMKLNLNEDISKGDIFEFSYEFDNYPMIFYKHILKDKNKQDNLFKNYYPKTIDYTYKDSRIVWKKSSTNRFLKPFYNLEISSNKKRFSSWEELDYIVQSSTFLEPKGFIFHTSRCGSTLLSNALSSLEKNIVIKESEIIHDVLTMNYNENTSVYKIKYRLNQIIKTLGRKRFDFEKNLYIKFNSWEIVYLDLIKELYPHTPIIILYANPKKILNSHQKKYGMHMVPNLLKGKLFDSIDKNLDFKEYGIKVLENIFNEMNIYKNKKRVLLVNYKDIKKIFFIKIAPFLHLAVDEKEKEIIKKSFTFYSKGHGEVFDEEKENIKNYEKINISSELNNLFEKLEEKKEEYYG